jgi:hypothetical protein
VRGAERSATDETLGEGKHVATYNKAEGEPRVALDHMAGHVATVMALAYETLIAGNLFAKGVFAARKKEEHGEDRWAGAS